MNYSDLMIAAFTQGGNNREKYGEDPLATREMYAVRQNRSIKTVTRNIIAKLFSTREEPAR